MAAAYASAGRFSEAIEAAEKALKIAESTDEVQSVERIREHLLLYKAGETYIELSPE